MKRLISLTLYILLALPILAEPADSFAIAIRTRIDNLMHDKMFERTTVGLYVYDLTADSALYAHDQRLTLRPASNMKVMTACTALSTLGTDYHLTTHLYTTGGEDTRVYVKGGMDPLLGPDDLHALTQALLNRGITDITSDIVCDATFKDSLPMGWGWCWDDDYVPLTPFLYLGKADRFESAFRHALRNAGIAFNGAFVDGRVPHHATLVATCSHSIDEVLLPMMKHSDNLYAECLFYQLGAKDGKPYASHKDAAAVIQRFIRSIGHDPSHYQIADGSGLSLYNYLSAELLVDALRHLYRHNQEAYQHLLASLPIMGRDGTLSKRCQGRPADGRVHAKTGTVRGVSSLSGYAFAPNGHTLAFSIINQGTMSGSVGRNFQDRVCCALTQPLPVIVEKQPVEAENDDSVTKKCEEVQ